MKEKHRLDNLFEQARSQKPIVELDDIEQVIRSGKRPSIQKLKLGKPGRGFFNPLKLIVMLSIVSLVLVLMLVPVPEQVRDDNSVDVVQGVLDVLAPEQVRGDKGVEDVGGDVVQVGRDVPDQVRDDNSVDVVQEVCDVLAPAPEQVRGDNANEQVLDLALGRVITLERSNMECLGIQELPNKLIYRNYFPYGYLCIEVGRLEHSSYAVFNDTKKSEFKPPLNDSIVNIFLSGIHLLVCNNPKSGASAAIVSSDLFPDHKIPNISETFDLCIPIEFKSQPDEIGYGTIFWFFPNDRLMDCLPDSIAIPMRKEFNLNVKPVLDGSNIASNGNHHKAGVREDTFGTKAQKEDPVPCEYFPSFCEGLPGLDNLNVYPNPTSGELNVEIILNSAKTIDYRVFDLTGRLVIDEVAQKKYDSSGKHTEKIDLGHLKSGFYLLVLTDELGARMTKRVVRE